MNERLSLQDLTDLLARKQEVTKKDAEAFLRELVAVISEKIENNEPVKIKDFGTFKLVKVNPRKSVNVNTGETIEIAAHYKLSFTPDKSLKEAINRPFAHFESVVLEEGVTFDNVENETSEEEDSEDTTVEEDITEYIAMEPEVAAIKDVTKPEPGLMDSELVLNGIENEIEKEAAQHNVNKEDIVVVIQAENPEKRGIRKRYIWLGFLIFLIIAGFAIGGLYFQEVAQYLTKGPHDAGGKAEITGKQDTGAENNIAVIDTVQRADTVKIQARPDSIKAVPANTPLATETIQPGHTLRNIALKHYGNKSFWVYIYEENRDKIKNPNNVPLGTELTIPAPSKYGINAQDVESVKAARAIEEKLFRQMEM
jgi:nucleoid DNA-binding protein